METKIYVYKVGNKKFIDEETCFGEAWKNAKSYAKEVHLPIYRDIIITRQDVYCDGGLFLGIDYAIETNNIYQF